MKVKGIIDYDCHNYKLPCLTVMFPFCTLKCNALNKHPVCHNTDLLNEPNMDVSGEFIWKMYSQSKLTKAFCFQGMEPFDSFEDLAELIHFIRKEKQCYDPIVIYTGYNKGEDPVVENMLRKYENIIVKWGRFIAGQEPHYDEILGVKLASDNQYAELIK